MFIRSVAAALLVVSSAAPLSGAAPAETRSESVAIHRENIEWMDVWIPNTNDTGLPRILLIGDSITKEYGPTVEKAMKGKAYVARLATSKSLGDPALLAEVSLVLSEMHFDIIHFNNGMHGHDYTDEQYAKAIPELIAALRKGAPGAKLMWVTTTPTRQAGHLDQVGEYTSRVIARNQAAAAVMEKEGISTDDLFSVVDGHPEYFKPDGVHHVAAGVAAEAKDVVAQLSTLLK